MVAFDTGCGLDLDLQTNVNMTSIFAKRMLTAAEAFSLLLCSTLIVRIAQAAPDETDKKTLRSRLVAAPRKIGTGVGVLLSPATSRVATVGAKVQGGFGVAMAGARAVRDGGARCVEFLTSTVVRVQDTVTHSPEPWDLGPDLVGQIQQVWANPPSLETALRDHLRLIYEARLRYVSSKINFETVAEAEAFQKTIGRFWSPQRVDYSDFLHDTIDPRIIPESAHGIELFRLTRELGLDFYERFDMIRANLSSIVTIAPLPGRLGVQAAQFLTGPMLDYRNENARIGALWEVARLLPVSVRETLLAPIEHHIQNQPVPDSERARFRRFVHAGEFERVAHSVETLQREGLLVAGSIGAEQLIIRSNELDGATAQLVRDDLRRKLKPEHPDHARLAEVVGPEGLRSLNRVFTQDEYLELDNGGEPAAQPEVRDRQLIKIIARYRWTRFKAEEREDIERALASLQNAHLEKSQFIDKLSDLHDNEFRRVVLKSVLPDFLTKRAPREIAR